MTNLEAAQGAIDIAVEIKQKYLVGLSPDKVGAILADLVAQWFAAHPKNYREQLNEMWVEMIRALIEIEDAEAMNETIDKYIKANTR